jgi:hypothetical protein
VDPGPESVNGDSRTAPQAPPAVTVPPAASTRPEPAAKGGNRWRRPFARLKIARLKIARHPPPKKGGTSFWPPGQGNGGSHPPRATDATSPENVLRWADGPRRRSGRRGAAGSGQAGERRGETGARPTSVRRVEAGTRRQRNLSARATVERVTAAQKASALRRDAAAAAAGLLWTRPPEEPTPYRLVTRLSDMRHGWLDGKHGLPRWPELPERKPRGESDAPFPVPSAQPAVTAEALPAVAVPATPPAWLQTPRMVLLCRRALELIRAEEQAFVADCAVYRRELSRFRKLRDAADEGLNQARATLTRAQRPLTDHELSARRLAEQGIKDRPESLVRARRQTEWERRLATATQAVQAATAQLAEATREAELREELIRDRMAVARAAALRHHEFHMRRIATYLQQLVRTHKQGADLNMLLMRYPVGPDLPEWTRNPHARDESSSL